MPTPVRLACLPLAILAVALSAACGGATQGVGPTADGGTSSDGATSGPDGRTTTLPDGAVCVDIDPSTLDESCNLDTDCHLVAAGQLCPGACGCGNTPIGAAGEAAYGAAISSVSFGVCACGALGQPRCLEHKCTACGGPNEPAGCSDGGATPVDAASMCVEISPSSFSLTCVADTDCTTVTTGMICPDACNCGDTPISTSSLAAWMAATSSLSLRDTCPCAFPGMPRCVTPAGPGTGTCTLCGPGPNQPAGCGDGG